MAECSFWEKWYKSTSFLHNCYLYGG